jgi:DNA-binding MarR family transcriptional regulator
VVSRSLIQLIKREPAVGWVRANELADRDATMELLHLRKQVDDLKGELASVRVSAPKGTEGLSQGEEKHVIQFTFKATEPKQYRFKTWKGSFSASWNDIFSYVSPLMIHEASNSQIESALSIFSKENNIDNLLQDKRIGEGIKEFAIRPDDFQTIIVQLRALGLITKSVKGRSVKDTETYWTLTPYGDEIMTRLRAIQRNEIKEIQEDIELEES